MILHIIIIYTVPNFQRSVNVCQLRAEIHPIIKVSISLLFITDRRLRRKTVTLSLKWHIPMYRLYRGGLPVRQ